MQEHRWRYDDPERPRQEGRRAALTLPRRSAETSVIDLRDAPARPSGGRRFAPYLIPESDRDALAAVALAAYQSSTQTPSVLDVDAAQLRTARSRRRREEPAEPQWTPPVLAVEEPAAVPVADEDDEPGAVPRSPRVSSRGRWLAGAVGVVLVALLGGAIASMMREREDQAVAQTAPAVPAAVADPALLPEDGLGEGSTQSGQPPVASVEGKLTLSEATFHDRLAGASAPASTVFAPEAEIILYLGYASWQPEPDDRLGVIWLHEGTEVGRSDIELADGTVRTSIAAPPLDQPGAYRADVTLNDEIVASLPFEIAAPTAP